MPGPREIRIQDYTYSLPDSRIARYPLDERDRSKLLVYKQGKINIERFLHIPQYLNKDDILVYNNTRVIRARLPFRKHSGSLIEVFCLEPFKPADYERSFASNGQVEWKCMIGNLKKWKSGTIELEFNVRGITGMLKAEKTGETETAWLVRFTWDHKALSFSEIIESCGRVPVPPYLKREDEEIDKSRYQTIYSVRDGSVAAPTAGLHFSDTVLDKMKSKGICRADITLHVGAGTFIPVKSTKIGGHIMHEEHFSINRNLLKKIVDKRVIAVGTTSLRTLESIYWIGIKIIRGSILTASDIRINQWDPYDEDSSISTDEAIRAVDSYMNNNGIDELEAITGIIIVPGYRFRLVKGLITNFHMPGSTLILLVAAFTGNNWRDIYRFALENKFRFLSYGDSSLLLP